MTASTANLAKPVPAVPGRWLLGNTPELARNVVGFLARVGGDHGPVASIKVLGKTYYVLSSPEAVQTVLVTQAKNTEQGPVLGHFAKPFLGESLLPMSGDKHRERKKLLLPVFQGLKIQRIAETMDAEANVFCDELQTPADVDFYSAMQGLTSRIAAKALFGSQEEKNLHDVEAIIVELNRLVMRETFSVIPLPVWFPTLRRWRMKQALKRLDAIIHGFIDERRDNHTKGFEYNDLLELLLTARTAQGEGLSAQHVRDEAVGLFVAGHETTATALSWIYFLLSKHPEIYEAVCREADATTGEPVGLHERMPLSAAVVSEALRLFPPAYVAARKLTGEIEVEGHTLPKGSVVYINIFGLHHRPDVFPEPYAFNPERFRTQGDWKTRKGAYIPFNLGPKSCIGSGFALTEMLCIMRRLNQRFRIEDKTDGEARFEPLVTLKPKDGFKVRIHQVA